MSFEKQMYEVKEKWEESYFSDQDRRRVEYIRKMIPADVDSLLDVGCGNGILVNYLKDNYASDFKRITGTDRSKTSLQFVKTEKFESDITNLPFKDDEFDISLCLEVIEHLPLEVYTKALMELARVSKKYVIVSVPYNEDLNFTKVVCLKCSTEFNPFYHMHSFVDEDIKMLFKDTDLRFQSLHKVESHPIPRFRYLKKWISKIIHPNSFPKHCICPMCGYNEFDKLKKVQNATSPEQEIKGGLSKWWPHKKETKWIAGFYAKPK